MARRRAKKKRKTAIVPKVVLSLSLAGVVPMIGLGCGSGPMLGVAAIFDMARPDMAQDFWSPGFDVAAIVPDMAQDFWSPGFDVAAAIDMTAPDGQGDMSLFSVAAIFDMTKPTDGSKG
jgi:hypothetical protein